MDQIAMDVGSPAQSLSPEQRAWLTAALGIELPAPPGRPQESVAPVASGAMPGRAQAVAGQVNAAAEQAPADAAKEAAPPRRQPRSRPTTKGKPP